MDACEPPRRRQTLRWLIAGLGAAAGAGWLARVGPFGRGGSETPFSVAGLFPGTAATTPDDAAFDPASAICRDAPPTAAEVFGALDAQAPRPVPASARCPVCGMFAARFPRWAAQAIYRDGATHFFDAPLCLMLHHLDVGRHAPGRNAADLVALHVTPFEPNGPTWVRAESAWFVLGSDTPGPMGEGNLPAFSSAVEAIRFAARHGGQPLAFDRIAPEALRGLDRRRHRHPGPAAQAPR